jgi:hypothetical protein
MTPFPASRWAAIGVVFLYAVTITAQTTTSRASLHQAILAEGWKVTPAEAAQFEFELVRDPKNLALRIRLLSYYYQHMIAEPRLRHVVWLIENRPDADVFLAASDITAMSPNWTGLNQAAGYQQVKALWLRQAERPPVTAKVFANAAAALSGADAEVSLELVKRARGVEPGNPEWTNWLAKIYEVAVRSSFAGGYPNIRIFAGAPQDRDTLPAFSLPLAAADALKTELATSTDAALVGAAGEALARESRLIKMRGATGGPEVEKSGAFGEYLLGRARVLEPENPRWRSPL